MPTKQRRTKRMPADNLVRRGGQNEIELKEDGLAHVAGGDTTAKPTGPIARKAGENPVEYLKITLTHIEQIPDFLTGSRRPVIRHRRDRPAVLANGRRERDRSPPWQRGPW